MPLLIAGRPVGVIGVVNIDIERIRQNIATSPPRAKCTPIPITLSMGIAALAGDCADVEKLIDRADKAMYAAKRSGRNRVEVFREGLI